MSFIASCAVDARSTLVRAVERYEEIANPAKSLTPDELVDLKVLAAALGDLRRLAERFEAAAARRIAYGNDMMPPLSPLLRG